MAQRSLEVFLGWHISNLISSLVHVWMSDSYCKSWLNSIFRQTKRQCTNLRLPSFFFVLAKNLHYVMTIISIAWHDLAFLLFLIGLLITMFTIFSLDCNRKFTQNFIDIKIQSLISFIHSKCDRFDYQSMLFTL